MTTPITPTQDQTIKSITQALNRRYATKQYQKNTPIAEELLETILEAWRLAPSSFGLDPIRFIVVNDQVTKDLLLPHAYNQPQISDASTVIVLTTETITPTYIDEFIASVALTRNVPISALDGYKAMISEIAELDEENRKTRENEQAHISLWCMLLTAAQLMVDATPMWWFIPEKFDEVLWLTWTTRRSVVVLTLGYRDLQDWYASLPKVRRHKDISRLYR
jgi:nitroreductase / dihydropteridine reductase